MSMALFLNELGYHPHIIDKKGTISPHSKALGVNPKTLEIFDYYGITERLLSQGRKMTSLNIWKGDKHIFKNELNKVDHKYPFMLILPQKISEEILVEALKERNIEVSYNTELISTKNVTLPEAIIQLNGQQLTHAYDLLIGADGGNSKVRQLHNIGLDGFSYNEKWELYDIELDTPLAADEGHIRMYTNGGMIMIRLKDNVWRVAGNMSQILNYLPDGTRTYDIKWQSEFTIHHKVAKQLNADNMALIGDAAHMHSPVGARGMNLGIEDAYILSKLIRQNEIGEYTDLRRPYLLKTVDRINMMTIGLAGNTRISRLVRNNLHVLSTFFPLLMPQARKFIMGLN